MNHKTLISLNYFRNRLLQELLAFCLQENVIRPAYSVLQSIVSTALKHEQKRLVNKLYTEADKGLRNHLDLLLDNDTLFHNLALLKKDQKNFTTKEIRKSVAKQRMLIEIYESSLLLIPKLGISEQNIIYYANLAEFYTIQKMKQMRHKNQVRLYLLCYAHRRLLNINDHLITSLNYKVSQYIAQANEYQKATVDTVEAVDKELRDKACKVLEVNINKKIPDGQVREKAFEIIPEPDYKQFLKDFKKPNLNREYYRWECYGSLAPTISRNLRPLFKSLTFSCAKQEMSEVIIFLKHHLEYKQSFNSYSFNEIPFCGFPKRARRFLTYKTRNSKNQVVKKIDGGRYEFMAYLQIQKGLSAGTVFVRDSNTHRSLEDELIDIEYWTNHKKEILAELNMPLLSMDVTDFLDGLETRLEEKYIEVNRRILRGENSDFNRSFALRFY